jgi:hypothetical protein
MYNNNDYGMKHIVIKNIDRAISSNWLKTTEELDQTIDSLKVQLEDGRELLKLRINKLSSCDHVYNQTTYTVQSRFLGYVTVYERRCKHCQYTETFQYSDDVVEELPNWTKNAQQRYYNNSI